ncbi:methyl-accepting chemotaxis protein [Caloramator sp. CAR-1]|uniref:methyl-accepting chemotaxis protein n=1 Tax=Caloramator sp. CAR-1 TaxID=3062777 RepID=UPI0026E392A2|nr:methyl-accepting chemotaxis protein [Caloramator sp. CAR-1]MDO6354753.1 methyl-accepting chemotaxis protein [Caloramator sp. CAR-1]
MKKTTTKAKIWFLVISIIVLFSIVINGIVYVEFTRALTRGMLRQTANLALEIFDFQYPGSWRVSYGELYKGSHKINYDFSSVDNLKKKADIECAIFLYDTRVTTTIEENGMRIVGSKVDNKVIEEVVKKGKDYVGEVKLKQKTYQGIYIPIKDTSQTPIGMFFVGLDKEKIDKLVMPVVKALVLFTLALVVVLSILIMIFMDRIIINPLQSTKQILDVIAKGDLTVNIEERYLKRRDEIGEISKAIASLKQSLVGIISKINENANSVKTSSRELVSVAEEMAVSSEQVSSSISQVATATENENLEVAQVVRLFESFGEKIDKMYSKLKEVKEGAEDTSYKANEGKDELDGLLRAINGIKQSFEVVTTKLQTLSSSFNQIENIVDIINNISEQTNLLALNAAIEAARAGEAGRGFAVVADEVRKLAEESKKFSDEIRNIIRGLGEEAKDVYSAAEEVDKFINEQITTVDRTAEKFEGIIHSIQNTVPLIEDAYVFLNETVSDKDGVLSSVENLSAIIQETSASVEEISATSEEMSSLSSKVADSAQNLSNMMDALVEDVKQFKL